MVPSVIAGPRFRAGPEEDEPIQVFNQTVESPVFVECNVARVQRSLALQPNCSVSRVDDATALPMFTQQRSLARALQDYIGAL
jgi:hypothetical protein